MVLGDEHLPVIHRPGLGVDVKRDLLALDDILIAMDQHMSLGEGQVRFAVEGHGVGLQESPGKGDQDFPRGMNGVFILVIGDAVRLDGDRSLGDILPRSRKGGRRRQKRETGQERTSKTLSTSA